MSAIQQLNVTLAGTAIEGIEIAVGTSLIWNLTCLDPSALTPLNLTGLSLHMSLVQFDIFGAPVEPPIAMWTATIVSAPSGTATITWLSSDTLSATLPPATSAAPLPGGYYGVDVWLEDGSGNRTPQLPLSTISLANAATLT